jgi:hypothetical protein
MSDSFYLRSIIEVKGKRYRLISCDGTLVIRRHGAPINQRIKADSKLGTTLRLLAGPICHWEKVAR